MAAEKYLINAFAIALDLTGDLLRKGPIPTRALLSEEGLQLRCRSAAWIIKQLQAGHTPVAIKDDELGLLR
ncbi:hypothetical protein D3C72_1253220 [compost metagenome]